MVRVSGQVKLTLKNTGQPIFAMGKKKKNQVRIRSDRVKNFKPVLPCLPIALFFVFFNFCSRLIALFSLSIFIYLFNFEMGHSKSK